MSVLNLKVSKGKWNTELVVALQSSTLFNIGAETLWGIINATVGCYLFIEPV